MFGRAQSAEQGRQRKNWRGRSDASSRFNRGKPTLSALLNALSSSEHSDVVAFFLAQDAMHANAEDCEPWCTAFLETFGKDKDEPLERVDRAMPFRPGSDSPRRWIAEMSAMCKEAGLEGDKAILITLVSKVPQVALPFEETVIGPGTVVKLCQVMVRKASFVAARAEVPVQVVKDDSRESSTAPVKPTGNGNSFVKHEITSAASKAGVDGYRRFLADRTSLETSKPPKSPCRRCGTYHCFAKTKCASPSRPSTMVATICPGPYCTSTLAAIFLAYPTTRGVVIRDEYDFIVPH